MSIGKATGISNFLVHMEVRVDKNGHVIPIEVKPMRFAGWCITDNAYYAYGINLYENYFHQKRPDWESNMQSECNSITLMLHSEYQYALNKVAPYN